MFRPIFKSRQRGQRGALEAPMLTILLPMLLGIGSLAVDTGHNSTVQTQMWNATSAGALAGALTLAEGAGTDAAATASAYALTGLNSADNIPVANGSGNTVVTTSINGVNPVNVVVTATRPIPSVLAKILGINQSTIATTSQATFYPTINGVGPTTAIPIIASLDQSPNGANGPGLPLNKLHIGDTVYVVIEPNPHGGNAAWTSLQEGSANTPTYRSILDQVLGLAAPDPDNPVPSVMAGQEVSTDHGLNNGVKLESTYADPLKAKPFVVMPVALGELSDSGCKSPTVMGFVTIKVISIAKGGGNMTMTGTLVKGMVPNAFTGPLPTTGTFANDAAIDLLSATNVKLTSYAPLP